MTYKGVIIGCGARAAEHIDAYKHLSNAKMAACMDIVRERRESVAAKYGLTAYESAAEMIEREKPDIVHVATTPHARVDIMTLVSDHQVPLCTVEKPIAMAVTDWNALRKLNEETKTRFAVCHQFRWYPILVKCQRAMADGVCGQPEIAHVTTGMTLTNQGTHTLNYCRSLIGDPMIARVFANASGWDTLDKDHPAPDVTAACLEFESGVRGLWTSGSISPRVGDPATTWQHIRVAAYGSRGRVVYEEFGKWEIAAGAHVESGDFGGMDTWKANNLVAQAGFYRAMFDWLTDGREAGTNLRVSLHEWSVILAVYQSAIERRPIVLKEFSPPDDLIERYKATVSTG